MLCQKYFEAGGYSSASASSLTGVVWLLATTTTGRFSRDRRSGIPEYTLSANTMLCLRCTRGFSALKALPSAASSLGKSTSISTRRYTFPPIHAQTTTPLTVRRKFTTITPLRPTLSSFRPASSPILSSLPSAAAAEPAADLLPKISTHPGLAGIQVRCGPRDTYDPSHFVRKRRHGFLSRVKTRKGRNLLTRRRVKQRKNLSH